MIPNTLDEWTLELIGELIEKQSNESDRHDFKKTLPDSETLTKTCCAFANSKGGFIILGVSEKGPSFKITGITNDKELSKKFGEKIKGNPTIHFNLPKIIEIDGTDQIIAIFEIPISPERPHVPDNAPDKRIFQKRTNKGNDFMSYDEIRFSFQDFQERREKIKLLYMELVSNIEMLNEITSGDNGTGSHYSLITLDDDILNGLLIELYSSIGQNEILMKNLFQIRRITRVTNNAIKIFFSKLAVPLSNITDITLAHNSFISSQSYFLKPIIEDSIKILGTEFNLQSPFK